MFANIARSSASNPDRAISVGGRFTAFLPGLLAFFACAAGFEDALLEAGSASLVVRRRLLLLLSKAEEKEEEDDDDDDDAAAIGLSSSKSSTSSSTGAAAAAVFVGQHSVRCEAGSS